MHLLGKFKINMIKLMIKCELLQLNVDSFVILGWKVVEA